MASTNEITGRRKWHELTQEEQTEVRWACDLRNGETYEQWWEALCDAAEEDGSLEVEGWPFEY